VNRLFVFGTASVTAMVKASDIIYAACPSHIPYDQ
jgi:hypothetical protein